jgi:hypothetical protein
MGPSRAAALLVAILIPACHGGGRSENPPPPTGPTEPPPAEVSWASDVWPILLVRCQVCHTVGRGAEEVPDMRMTDPSTLYDRWVRIFAQCNPNLFRVLPGDSERSFVYDKISRPAPLCGQRMPLDGPMLEPEEQLIIKDWIDQGARRN